jgi:hypothetical protein
VKHEDRQTDGHDFTCIRSFFFSNYVENVKYLAKNSTWAKMIFIFRHEKLTTAWNYGLVFSNRISVTRTQSYFCILVQSHFRITNAKINYRHFIECLFCPSFSEHKLCALLAFQPLETPRSSHMRTTIQYTHNKLYPITSPLATRLSANDNTQNWFYSALPNKHAHARTHTHTQTPSCSRAHSRFPRQPIRTAVALMQKSSPSCIRLTIKY